MTTVKQPITRSELREELRRPPRRWSSSGCSADSGVMITPDRYTYSVIWFPEDDEYVGLCTEFSSLSWLAPAQAEAMTGIRSLVTDVVADMLANNEPIPPPANSPNV